MTAETEASADYTTQQIRAGRRTPLPDLQARYDTFRRWSEKDKLSFAQIAARWADHSGQHLSRARVHAILHRPRPGTVSKGSTVAVLRRRIAELEQRKAEWSARNSERGDARAAQLGAEIRSLQQDLEAAEKEARRLSRVGI